MNETIDSKAGASVRFDRERFKATFWELYGIPVATVVLFVLFSVLHKNFLTFSNLMNILRATSIIAIVAIGTTILMISGNVDISMASIMAVSGVLTIGLIVDFNVNPALAIQPVALFHKAIDFLIRFFTGFHIPDNRSGGPDV